MKYMHKNKNTPPFFPDGVTSCGKVVPGEMKVKMMCVTELGREGGHLLRDLRRLHNERPPDRLEEWQPSGYSLLQLEPDPVIVSCDLYKPVIINWLSTALK